MTRISQRSKSFLQKSQLTLEESFQGVSQSQTCQNIDEQVSTLVHYIINRAGENTIFKRTDLKKNVLPKSGENFQAVIDKAASVLIDVYGYKMMAIEGSQASLKSYIISNNLPYIQSPVQLREQSDTDNPDDVHKILLLLILSHIFMSHNPVSEASLYSFLSVFKIDIEKKHELFGNVKDYIFSNLKSKKYIEIITDQMSKKVTFTWGPRAEKEISKHDILNFVCRIYKDRIPSAWTNQFEAANEQQEENHWE